MLRRWIPWLLVAVWFPSKPVAAETNASETEIRAAVERLSDKSFEERERAQQFLWEQGRAAEAPLRAALQTDDAELRRRAQRILDDFQAGILPGIPAEEIGLLRQMRDADLLQRTVVMRQLLQRERVELVLRVLRLEKDVNNRRNVLVELCRNEQAVGKLAELNKTEELLAIVVKDPDAAWRQQMLTQVLTHEKVLVKLAEGNQPEKFTTVLKSLPSKERSGVLMPLVQDSRKMASLLQTNGLNMLFAAVATVPDGPIKASLFAQILRHKTAQKQLHSKDALWPLMIRVAQQMEEAERPRFFGSFFQFSAPKTALIDKFDAAELVKSATAHATGRLRGEVLAAMQTSDVFRQEATNLGGQFLPFEAVRDDGDREVRRGFLAAYVDLAFDHELGRHPQHGLELWNIAWTDGEPEWRRRILPRLLNNPGVEKSLADRAQADRLLAEIQRSPADAQNEDLLRTLIGSFAVRPLLQQERFEELVKLLQAQPAPQISILFANFARSHFVAEHLIAKQQLNRLLELVDTMPDAVSRRRALSGLFANHVAMEWVAGHGNFDSLKNLALAEPDEQERAKLWSVFINHKSIVAKLVDRGEFDELLTFAKNLSDAQARRAFVSGLAKNVDVLRRLSTSNRLDDLLAIVSDDSDPTERARLWLEIVSSVQVIELVLANRIPRFMRAMFEIPANAESQSVLSQLFYNSVLVESLVKRGQFARLWALAKRDPQPQSRAQRMSLILEIRGAIPQLIADQELALVTRTIAEEQDGRVKSQLVNALLGPNRLPILIDQLSLDELLTLISHLSSPQERNELRGRLLTSPAAIKRLMDEKRLGWLIEQVRTTEDIGFRNEMLLGLTSSAAMRQLTEQGHAEPILKMLFSEPAAKESSAALNNLVLVPSVAELLAQPRWFDQLLERTKTISDLESRTKLLQNMLANELLMDNLKGNGRLAALWKRCAEEPDATQCQLLLTAWLSTKTGVEQLTVQNKLQETIQSLATIPSGESQRELLKNLLTRSLVTEQLATPEAMRLIIGQIQHEPNDQQRRSMYVQLLIPPATSAITKGLAWNAVLTAIQKERDPNIRANAIQLLDSAPDFNAALADKEFLQFALDLAQAEKSDATDSMRLLSLLYSKPVVLEKLRAENRVGALMEAVQAMPTMDARRMLLSQMVRNSQTLDLLVAEKQLPALLREVNALDPKSGYPHRSSLLGTLLSHPKVADDPIAAIEWTRLIDYVKAVEPGERRITQAVQLLGESRLLSAAIHSGHLESLLAAAQDKTDDKVALPLFAGLLSSHAGVDYLMRQQKLDSTFDNLGQLSPDRLPSVLQSMTFDTLTLSKLVASGRFQKLLTFAEQVDGPRGRARMLWGLANTKEGADLIVKEKLTTDWLAAGELLSKVSNGVVLHGTSQALISNALEAGQFDRLWKLATPPGNQAAAYYVLTFLTQPAVFEHLAKTARLREVVKQAGLDVSLGQRQQLLGRLFSQQPTEPNVWQHAETAKFVVELLQRDPAQTKMFRDQLLQSEKLRQAIMASGQGELLTKLAALEPNPTNRARMTRTMTYSPSGELGEHLIRGNFAAAEELLEQDAQSDVGRARLATYWLLRGKLTEQIVEQRQRLTQDNREHDRRLLVYLMRAAGDLAGAIQVAEPLKDEPLAAALLLELGDWESLATTERVTALLKSRRTPADKIESDDPAMVLGVQALFQRWSKRDAAADATITKLKALRPDPATNQPVAVRRSTLLLLNDQLPTGLSLIQTARPDLAFALLLQRRDYEPAWNVIGVPAEFTFDPAWIEQLPSSSSTNEPLRARWELAMAILESLQQNGRNEEANRMCAAVEAWLAGAPKTPETNAQRIWYGEQLQQAKRTTDGKHIWWKGTTWKGLHDNLPFSVQSRFSSRGDECQAWWRILQRLHPNESAEQIAQRASAVLAIDSPEDLRPHLAQAEPIILAIEIKSLRGLSWNGLGQSCSRLGDHVTARRFFENAIPDHPWAARHLATSGWQNKAWDEAAKKFEQLWQADRAQPGLLFAAGEAARRGKQSELAERWTNLANLLTVDANDRVRMMGSWVNLDISTNTQFEILLKSAPIASQEWAMAANRLATKSHDESPELAALRDDNRWPKRSSASGVLRLRPACWEASLGNIEFKPAPIARQDWAAANREQDLAMQADPAEVVGLEDLRKSFVRAKRTDEAATAFQRNFDFWSDLCQRFSRNALHHERLAWLAASAGLRLDDALRHAEEATRLEPFSSAYRLTLAEVHFHRGDREKALEQARQAAQLAPDSRTIREQLKRFQNEPLPK